MGELQEASGRSAELRALIYAVRGEQVMLDRDLATLYGVETKVLNQAVTRNLDRFPERYSFKLTPEEAEDVRSQIVTLSGEPMRIAWWRYPPRVFTEQGIPASFPRLRSSRMALGGHELGEAVEGSRLEGGIKAVRVVDNPGLAGIMALDSTGGGGRQARVKPPVVCFRSDFHEPEAAPVVYDLELMGAVAEAACRRCTRLLRSHRRGPAFHTFRIPASCGAYASAAQRGRPCDFVAVGAGNGSGHSRIISAVAIE